LPEELSWLPLIESGYKVRALSNARALGLWQFIASTGYKYGLKRTRLIDERMDPEKSTEAAIAYLKELHQIFGDWTTVLAAYNCGEWRVLKRIRGQKINYLDHFWDLYAQLPRETAFYVPRFLAVLHILNDPELHGFDLPPVDEKIEAEAVTIDKQVHLKAIAKSLDIDYGLLKSLNSELRLYYTPDDPYELKTPVGKGALLLTKLNEIPVWRPPKPTYVVHRVRRGDSLSVIAVRYGSSVSAIMAANGLRRKDYLRVGWKLKVPTKGSRAYKAKTRPNYQLKQKGKLFEYRVRKGDSLWEIAHRYNTTTKSIMSLNRLKSTTLRIGQVLLLSPGRTTTQLAGTKRYTVKEGDSPYLIAKRHEMNLAGFLRMNDLTPRSTIFPGQVVRIKIE
jgi:membrane-bound lytic murein transglycosylase D